MPDEPEADALVDAAYETIQVFSTALFGAKRGERTRYRGSGTFVRVAGRPCLLTASHVWELLHMECDTVFMGTNVHRQPVQVRRSEMVCVYASDRPMGGWTPWGPDLALVGISKQEGALLAAGKAFLDLTRWRENALAAPVAARSGIWLLVGAPDEGVEVAESRRPDGLRKTRVDMDDVVISGQPFRASERDGLDYVELPLHDKPDADFPIEYKGMSGAGLWHVGEKRGDAIVWDGGRVSFEGVAFYHVRGETPEDECIRCHGPRSVYEYLLSVSGLLKH